MTPMIANQFKSDHTRLLRTLSYSDAAHAPSIITSTLVSARSHNEWNALLMKLYTDVGLEFADRTGAEISASGYTREAAQRYVAQYAARFVPQRVDELLRATARRVNDELKTELASNKSVLSALGNALKHIFTGLQTAGAPYLAENAVVHAGNTGMFAGAKSFGVGLDKVWSAVLDNQTRPAHAAANGQTVGLDDPFMVGGEQMLFPLDTSLGASGANIFNCRCVTEFTVKGGQYGASVSQNP